MRNHLIIDTHAHLWVKQDTAVEGKKIRSLTGGKSEFMGEIRQMMPPYLTDGANTAEIFIANMDYAQVAAAVITQEFIDGNQDAYLLEVQERFSNRFLTCALIDPRVPTFELQFSETLKGGFRAAKLPANRLVTDKHRTYLTEDKLMGVFKMMEENKIILSIDLADGELQVAEMEEIIREYPQLKIAIGHFGMVTRKGWEKQIKLARHENVRIESGGITWLFHNEFYPYPSAVQAIRRSIDWVGEDKLMWGSDYPRTMTAITYQMSWDFLFRSKGLSEKELQKFLGHNAQQFYGFRNIKPLPRIKSMVE